MEEEEETTTLIPYGTHRQEQKRSFKKKTYHSSNWFYKETDDFYWCPNQRIVTFRRYSKRTDRYGYTRDVKMYECESCEGCPLKADCTKATGNRQVHYNPVYEELKAKEKAKLHSDEGRTLYAKRNIDVESVFGHVKQNLGFRRLHLRGLEKVQVELGWVALAHNLRKVVSKRHLPTSRHLTNRFLFLRGFWDSPILAVMCGCSIATEWSIFEIMLITLIIKKKACSTKDYSKQAHIFIS